MKLPAAPIAILKDNGGHYFRYYETGETITRVSEAGTLARPEWDYDILTEDIKSLEIVALVDYVGAFYLSDDGREWIDQETEKKIREFMAA